MYLNTRNIGNNTVKIVQSYYFICKFANKTRIFSRLSSKLYKN